MMTLRFQHLKQSQQGATLLEFSFAAIVFFIVLFSVLEMGRLFWIHNALADAVRKGARYAAMHAPTETAQVKTVVLYGTAAPLSSAPPVAVGLTPEMIQVTYTSPFGVKVGAVTVTISGYEFNSVVPLIPRTFYLPAYKSTMTAESAGMIP